MGRLLAELLRRLAAGAGAVGRVLVVVPLTWFGRYVLVPFGRLLLAVLLGVGTALEWSLQHLLAAPLRLLATRVLLPGVRALAAAIGAALALVAAATGLLGRGIVLFVRRVLVPGAGLLLRLLAAAVRAVAEVLELLLVPVAWCWRRLLRPVLRELGRAVVRAWRLGGRLWRYLVVRPCRWLRREVWWPARDEIRRVVREVRAALVG
ncbi:hypothetical protein [Kitasatospora paranensis]|uniref:hypothetical protein n=1 Tax=Kitasatospora paranensis TaxID=258053 RepID=UPI0031EA4086